MTFSTIELYDQQCFLSLRAPYHLEFPHPKSSTSHSTPGKSCSTPLFPKVQQILHWGLMERCVIHHTSYIVPFLQLPALRNTGPYKGMRGGGGMEGVSGDWGSRSHPVAMFWQFVTLFLSVGALIPSSNPLLSPLRPWPLYKAPQAKQSKIDALQMASWAREGSQFNAWNSPFFPSQVPTVDTKVGAWSQGIKNSTFIHLSQTNGLSHYPNLPFS